MAHVAEYKKKIVKEIIDLANQYPIIGLVNMENLPAPQLQKMRAQLRDKIKFAMTKKRLMKIALEEAKNSKKGIEKLKELFVGMPALIFTKENPFKLFKMLKKNKSPAPAKPGQIAPRDIIVPAGPTSFAPGPIIGELGQIGVKAGVEGGKVAVKADSVVARKGDKIKPKVAEILTRLGIEPMEVGLDLVATYEDGTIYQKNILDIDEDRFMADLRNCANGAFNLAMFVAYPTKNTIKFLISKAFNDSKALGLSQNIIDEGIVNELLAKAQRQMLSLSSIAKIEVKEKEAEPEKKEEVKELKHVKVEKPKAEAKPEVKEEKPAVKKERPEVYIPKVEEKRIEKELEEKKRLEEQKRIEEEKKKEEHRRRAEEERRKKEEQKIREMEEQEKAEEERKKQEESRKQEEAIKAEERKIQEEQRRKELEEQKRAEEERRKAEELRIIEEEKRKELELKKLEEERQRLEEEKRREEQRLRETEKKEDEIDIKVREMVEKTKKMAMGTGPSAADILEEVKREMPIMPAKAVKEEVKKEQPEAERLLAELQRKGTLRGVNIGEMEKKKFKVKEPKEDEQKKVEDLYQKLKRKGTLR